MRYQILRYGHGGLLKIKIKLCDYDYDNRSIHDFIEDINIYKKPFCAICNCNLSTWLAVKNFNHVLHGLYTSDNWNLK